MCAWSERPVGSEIIEGVSLQLGSQQGRGYVRVVKRVMYGHVKDEELGNSLMLAMILRRWWGDCLRFSWYRHGFLDRCLDYWYSPENAASSTADKTNTSTTANVSANTQTNTR